MVPNIATQPVPAQQINPASNQLTGQPPVNDQNEQEEQTTIQSSDLTVNISSETFQTSADDNNAESGINSNNQARQLVAQFSDNAANDPVTTQQAQNNVTSDTVKRLIG